MRWYRHHHGKTRVVKRFALFPIEIAGECRWLEICYIKQKYNFWLEMWFNEEFVESTTKEMLDEN